LKTGELKTALLASLVTQILFSGGAGEMNTGLVVDRVCSMIAIRSNAAGKMHLLWIVTDALMLSLLPWYLAINGAPFQPG
jgi:hypothetical protein